MRKNSSAFFVLSGISLAGYAWLTATGDHAYAGWLLMGVLFIYEMNEEGMKKYATPGMPFFE